MSLVLRITLVILVVCGGALFAVTRVQLDETARRYREATEEPLVDIAMVLAAMVAEASPSELTPNAIKDAISRVKSSKLQAKIYDLQRNAFDLRIYVTDPKGTVLYDSDSGQAEGQDYSNWNDVYKTLHGEYGARSSHFIASDSKEYSMLYVAAPIRRDETLLGSLSVGKPTRSADLFARGARVSTLMLGLVAFSVCALLAFLLAFAVSSPVLRLTKYAKEVRDGKRPVLPKLPGGELRNLGAAFEEMRDALEGRKYVEQYVQTLAHALKSPLSGIRGAIELLKEDLPPEERTRFISNIASDSTRMLQLIDKLLALSTLQKEKALVSAEILEARAALQEAVSSVQQAAASKKINITISEGESVQIRGNRLWLHEALTNLLVNAIDFSPSGGKIEASVERTGNLCEIKIRDHGPGVPDWAAERIFERFYSLPRPHGGSKSTGLGLSIVREVAALHSGAVVLMNHRDGGALASFSAPIAS